jgi:hypothetical protein
MKCTVVDMETAATGCGIAGPRTSWQRCASDVECADGLWCDLALFACKPFCNTINDCGGAECVRALKDDGMGGLEQVGEVRHCTSGCSPIDAMPCDTTGNVTCVYLGVEGFDCAQTLNKQEGSPCGVSTECVAGMLCELGSATCRAWCEAGPTLACADLYCNELNPKIFYQGTEMGVCAP